MSVPPTQAGSAPSTHLSSTSGRMHATARQLEALFVAQLTQHRTRKSRRVSQADMLFNAEGDGDGGGGGDGNSDGGEAAERDGAPKDYSGYGRAFARLGEPFSKIATIVHHGLQVESQDTDDERDETVIDRRLTDDWRILCATIPGFKAEMVELAERRVLRRSICLTINSGVDNARSDDTSGLKKNIISYLLLDVAVPLDPPIHPNNPRKSCRGWNHPVTARLITPIELPANTMTCAEIVSGRRKVTGHQLPRFLYPEDHVYDEDNIEGGLFRGHLMFRCAKHVLMGPSAALEVPGFKRGRSGVGRIIGLSKMTARAVAYIAVQVRFALSDAPEWSLVDRDFHYETFFWNLVELLEGEDGKDILAVYDNEVFGVVHDTLSDISSASSTGATLAKLKVQRAAKRLHVD